MKSVFNYAWRGFRFEIPGEIEDETIVTLVDRKKQSEFSLSLTMEPIDSGFELNRYATDQVAALKATLPRFTLESNKPTTAGGAKAVRLEYTTVSEGDSIRQIQAYVQARSSVLIVTLSLYGTDQAPGKAALDQLLSTLSETGAG